MKIPIVNEKDEIIGYKERGTCLPNDINRASGLWIENTKGQVLLIKRSSSVVYAPNVLSVLTGTVDDGEDYESNILKEAEEEIGLRIGIEDLQKIDKVLYSNKDNPYENRYFVQWFKIVKDVDPESLNIDKNEVAWVKWYSKQEVLDLFNANPELFFMHFDLNLKMIGWI